MELVNCEILKEDKRIDAIAVQTAVTRFLYEAGCRRSPLKEELKNCTCSKQTLEKIEESCITWLASRNALDPKQAC